MEINFDEIIAEVLRRMGARKEVALIEGLEYEAATLEKLKAFDLVYVRAENGHQLSNEVSVVLPELTLSQMMATASGVGCDSVSESFIVLLAQGIAVRVFRETVQIEQLKMAKTAYAKRFVDAYQLLCDAGLKVCDALNTAPLESSKSKVFTEKDAMRCVAEGVKQITLPKATLVTPLARDYARYNHLAIEKEL